jgi:hypothetical protein
MKIAKVSPLVAVQADPEPQRLVSSYRLGYSQVSGLGIDGNVLKATALKQIRLPGGLGLSSPLQGMFCKHRQSEGFAGADARCLSRSIRRSLEQFV